MIQDIYAYRFSGKNIPGHIKKKNPHVEFGNTSLIILSSKEKIDNMEPFFHMVGGTYMFNIMTSEKDMPEKIFIASDIKNCYSLQKECFFGEKIKEINIINI